MEIKNPHNADVEESFAVTTRPEDLCFAIFFAGLNSLVLRKVIYFLYYDLIITQG